MTAAIRSKKRAPAGADAFDAAKARRVREIARAKKLIGEPKRHVLNARLDENLVAAAKARTGIASDTELVEVALASLAVEGDFGAWLLAQGGRLDPDFDLDL